MSIKNINHITLNTRHNAQYKDDSVMSKEDKKMFAEIVDNAIKEQCIEIADGISLMCSINLEKKSYMATMVADEPFGIPLLTTSGAVDEQDAERSWTLQKELYEMLFYEEPSVICPQTPFISDVLYPGLYSRDDVTKWSGYFTKSFGIEMIKRLSEYGGNLQTEKKEEIIMMREEKKKEEQMVMMSSEVGKTYQSAFGHPDGVYFDVDDCGITLDIYFSNATKHEIEQIGAGNAFEMKLTQLRGIIFPLFKFGDLNWVDAPYNVHLSRGLTRLAVPEDGVGFSMLVRLFDPTTGKLCCTRLISLSTEMSRKLIDMIAEQKKEQFNRMNYDNRIKSIFDAYTTKKMVKMAVCSYKMAG